MHELRTGTILRLWFRACMSLEVAFHEISENLQIKQDALDEFSRKRLQKVKLSLRDEIVKIEQVVYPDIIA